MEKGSDFLLRKDLMEVIEKARPVIACFLEVPRAKHEFIAGDVLAEYQMWVKIRDAVRDLPGTDRLPMVYGRWIPHDFDMAYECSTCGYITEWHLSKYCPECGAKMNLQGEKEF